MSDILSLYLSALNSSTPGIILLLLGILSVKRKLYPAANYGNLSAMAFKVCLPIKTVYTLATQNLTGDDFLIVAAYMVTCFVSLILIVPFIFVYPRRERGRALSGLMAIIWVNNCVISGIPVFSGLYGDQLASKYAYLQLLAGFGGCIPFVFIGFEFSMGKPAQSKCSLVKKSLLKTISQPSVVGVIVALVFNAVFQALKITIPPFTVPFFDIAGALIAPLGFMMLGMFWLHNLGKVSTISKCRNAVIKTYIQLMRHLIVPLMLAVTCKLMGIKDRETVEVTVGIFASPTAVYSFVVCNEYKYCSEDAAFDAIFGIISGMLVIPILQLFVRFLWSAV